MSQNTETHLGRFLKEKRERIAPESLGYTMTRRRTPGLRREEVAQRANISVTWYTWLEQGRGGTPSPEVLHRIAKALLLSPAETEYLFLTTLGRSSDIDYQLKEEISPRFQSILDALNPNPAIIRNLTWDILAWNHAATVMFTDYSTLSVNERNVMRLFFLHKELKPNNIDWQDTAKLLVSAFRSDLARLGENEHTKELIKELCAGSIEFSHLWHSNEVSQFTAGVIKLQKSTVANGEELSFDYSSFDVSGSPELSLIVYTPSPKSDEGTICQLMQAKSIRCDF